MPASAAQRKAAQQEAARLLTPEGVEREAAQKEAARLLAQEKEAAQKEAARLLVEAAKTAAEAAEGAPQASPQASSCTGLGALETAAYAECDVEHLVCGSWEPATVLERGNAGVLIAYASGGEAFVDDFGDLRPMYRVRAVADKCGALCGGAAQLVPSAGEDNAGGGRGLWCETYSAVMCRALLSHWDLDPNEWPDVTMVAAQTSIMTAVAAAATGTVLIVQEGSYNELIVMESRLAIVAKGVVQVDAIESSAVFGSLIAGVTVGGQVTVTGHSDLQLKGCAAGLLLCDQADWPERGSAVPLITKCELASFMAFGQSAVHLTDCAISGSLEVAISLLGARCNPMLERCTIRHSRRGLLVQEGGAGNLHSCDFSDCGTAVTVCGEGSSLKMDCCQLRRNEHGVALLCSGHC